MRFHNPPLRSVTASVGVAGRPVLSLLAAALLGAMAAPAVAQTPRPFTEAELRQAAYLAANCANCHGTGGRSVGAMPSLAGVPRGYLVQQMKDFRDGRRPATIMHQLAKGYTDDQFELLGEYFARQRKP